jgi:hypothetical protein
MALEGMHDELLRHLRERGATQFLIDAWENAWYQAQIFKGEPLPCPLCFIDGRVQRLVPLDSVGALGVARCEACKVKFTFPGG